MQKGWDDDRVARRVLKENNVIVEIKTGRQKKAKASLSRPFKVFKNVGTRGTQMFNEVKKRADE